MRKNQVWVSHFVGCLMTLFTILQTTAQEFPPMRNFSPNSYGAENQNWGIAQSQDKLLYVANNKGLLEFNGANWTLYPSPNETIIRSLHVVEERIYTGCYREFGYWVKNKFGRLEYSSLSKEIETQLLEDEEFWNITYVEGKVFFQSKMRLYSYDTSTQEYHFIDAQNSLPRIFNTETGIYIQANNEGLFRVVNNEKVLISANSIFKEDEIIAIFSKGPQPLVLTRNNGFFNLLEGEVTPWEIPTTSLLKQSNVYSAIELENGNYAIGTVSRGMITITADGDLVYNIDQNQGLRNNTVLALFEDVENNIWMGLDNGIAMVSPSSPFKVYKDQQGVIGSVYASVKTNGKLYVGTNQGLYVKETNSRTPFKLLSGTAGQVWSLHIINDTLFCGHHTGTLIVEGETIKKVSAIPGTWKIETLKDKDLLIQGNYDGLYVLEKKNSVWKLRNKIEGFNNSSRYFEVIGERIFVNHEYKGVFIIDVDPAFRQVKKVDIEVIEPGFNSSISKFMGVLRYAHKDGVWRYNATSATFERDSIFSAVYTPETYVSGKMVVDEEKGALWFFSKDKISQMKRGKLNESFVREDFPISVATREAIDGYESITPISDQQYLLSTASGYVILDLEKMQPKEFNVHIQNINVLSKTQSGQLERFVENTANESFSYDTNNLRFSYYTPSYDKFNIPKYQFQLEGIYADWSDWSEDASVTFENIPPGNYTFKVRSLSGGALSSNEASFSFKIERPWFLSTVAMVIYAILLAIVGLSVHSAYRKYYRKRQEKLIAKNKRDIELTKAQNEKEIIKIKNEQLQQEFKSKSNELAASTLSIIRKNELLTRVKEELMTNSENKEFAKPLVDIIDKNLKKNDDWELFKEAFNNADRKFMKKLKKAHPKLTPNDIRLCAYLRLNLSSKEIAPLLNISPRSVEIKRYRLRKKMNLSHDDNLVNYILKL